ASRSPSIAKRNTARANSSGFTVLLPNDLSVSHASSKAASKSTSVCGSKEPLLKPRIAHPRYCTDDLRDFAKLRHKLGQVCDPRSTGLWILTSIKERECDPAVGL